MTLFYAYCFILLINLIAFVLMAIDKYKAIKNKFRIKENTLILWGALFGGLGFYLGMKVFRHKTQKKRFTLLAPFFVITQSLIVLALIKYAPELFTIV